MSPELDRLEAVLFEATRLAPQAIEQNIFALGARRYFENPTSDLLAFFLDPSADHGLRDLFLRALVQAAGLVDKFPERKLSLNRRPEREVYNGDGKKMDID